MTSTELDRVFQLHKIIKNSDSMSEIYAACKEVVKLHDGYEVKIIPNDPNKTLLICNTKS